MNLNGLSTADLLAGKLKELINRGFFPDGARLIERDIATQFSVSRIPVREAIHQLERQRIVDVYRNRGAVVRKLSDVEVRDIFKLRALLEGDAIYDAVINIDTGVLKRAELVHSLLGETNISEKQGILNLEFHNLLYSTCKNERQLTLIQELRDQIERYEHLQRRLLADTKKFQHDHAAILAACKKKDAALARKETVSHILSAGDVLREFINR